jgi:hypothetical protein
MSTVEQRVTALERAMAELAVAQARTQQNLDQLSAEMREFKEEMREFKDEMREFKEEKEEMRGFKDEMRGFKDEMRGFKEEMGEFKDTMQAFAERNDREWRKWRRQWGELANKMGTLVEDVIAPGIPSVFRRVFGWRRLELSAQRLRCTHRDDPGRMQEFDYVAAAGDVLLVTETRSTVRPEDIPALVALVEEARAYLPQAEGRSVVGGLAGFSLDPTLVTAGERQGLLMFGLGTGLLRVLNTPGFQPRRF